MELDVDLDRPRWLASLPFFGVHVAAVVTPFVAPFEWQEGWTYRLDWRKGRRG